MADFRSWLYQAAAVAAETTDRAAAPAAVDLHTLLSQFIALRHEVNLQTRAARAQQEQNGEALRRLGQAVEALEQSEEEALEAIPNTQEEILRPLLKTLVDVADALDLARRKMLQAQQAIWPLLEQIKTPMPTPSGAEAPAGSWWARWFGSRPDATFSPRSQPHPGEEAANQVRRLLDALIQGYTMSLQRIERVLEQYSLERIDCVGQPFDPERMEVMDVVDGSDRPSGEVVEEVRRGYLWRGRVFRFALVRVAKS